jgi:predicted dehydrogenase
MEKVRVAIIGCGGIAASHAIRFQDHPDAELAALCDIDREQIDRFVERIEGERAGISRDVPILTDAGAVYRDVRPDAVSIATPHTLHYEQCCQALEAGCHVLVEKPMVTSLEHALALERKVAQSGRQLQIAYITPSRAECVRLRDICRSGEYGRLRVVNCSISQPWYQGTKGRWRQDPALSGGGMIYDSGAHVLNTLVWTVESDVDEVHAYLDRLDSAVDINGTINVRFKNRVFACVAVCGEAPPKSGGVWNFETATVSLDPWIGAGLKVFTRVDGRFGDVDAGVKGNDSNPQQNFIDAIPPQRRCPEPAHGRRVLLGRYRFAGAAGGLKAASGQTDFSVAITSARRTLAPQTLSSAAP